MRIDSTSILADARQGEASIAPSNSALEEIADGDGESVCGYVTACRRGRGVQAVDRLLQNDGALISWTAALTAANDIRTQ